MWQKTNNGQKRIMMYSSVANFWKKWFDTTTEERYKQNKVV